MNDWHIDCFLRCLKRQLGIKDFVVNNAGSQNVFCDISVHWPELDEDLSYEGFFKADSLEGKSELYILFKRFPQINVAGLARSLGIKQSLMAAYVCGTKKPSLARRNEIIVELHALGRALLEIA